MKRNITKREIKSRKNACLPYKNDRKHFGSCCKSGEPIFCIFLKAMGDCPQILQHTNLNYNSRYESEILINDIKKVQLNF